MANVLVEETSLQNIANSIREKTGTTDTYKPSEMASAISGIQSGGGSVPENGIVINEWDSDGYPTNVSFFTTNGVPYYYFYSYKNAYGEKSFFANMITINLPDTLTWIGESAFSGCSSLALTELPSGVKNLGNSVFSGCSNLRELTIKGDINNFSTGEYDGTFSSCTSLSKIILPNITKVPNMSLTTFYNTPIRNGGGYVYVPNNLLNDFISATNWSAISEQIRVIDFESVEINDTKINTYNNNKTITLKITYNGGADGLFKPEQEGYTLSVSGNATLDGNVLTLTDNAQVGDIITVTVTSTYDNSISSTQEIEVVYIEPSITVNLNNGQWVDSGTTTDTGSVIYKSDAGSYNINNGKSTAILTVVGYTNVKLYIRSYAEGGYDYTEAFAVDTTATRAKGLFSTKNNNSATKYVECVYKLDDGTHTIEIMYSKDGSGNSNDDRGYFYIGEVS